MIPVALVLHKGARYVRSASCSTHQPSQCLQASRAAARCRRLARCCDEACLAALKASTQQLVLTLHRKNGRVGRKAVVSAAQQALQMQLAAAAASTRSRCQGGRRRPPLHLLLAAVLLGLDAGVNVVLAPAGVWAGGGGGGGGGGGQRRQWLGKRCIKLHRRPLAQTGGAPLLVRTPPR